MPTLYKPVLSEIESIWEEQIKSISVGVSANRRALEKLNFHEEHGRPGSNGGKFDAQIASCENEVLSEISAILTNTFLEVANPRPGEIVATLEWIRRNPSRIRNGALPGFAEWLIAEQYQRADEKRGTHSQDITGFMPDGYAGTIEIPSEESIVKAASEAISHLYRRRGRPSSEANRILAEGLRDLHLRYNPRITRHSGLSFADGDFVQVETGPFFDFVSVAIEPLQNAFGNSGLPLMKVSSIVRTGRYPLFSIQTRFKIKIGFIMISVFRALPAAATQGDLGHGQPAQPF